MQRRGAVQRQVTDRSRAPKKCIKSSRDVVRQAITMRQSGMTFADIGDALHISDSSPRYWYNLHRKIGDAMFDTLEFEDPTQRVKVPALRYRWHEYDADTRERLRVWLGEVTG